MNSASLKKWLVGQWALQRTVLHHNNQYQFHMNGSVTFSPLGDDLIYQESGQTLSQNYQGDFYQTYIFKFSKDSIQICFADGKSFHFLNFKQNSCTATHQCKNDHYTGMFKIIDDNTLHIHWKIMGPRKDQEISSILTKT